jgi:hypothetical protein
MFNSRRKRHTYEVAHQDSQTDERPRRRTSPFYPLPVLDPTKKTQITRGIHTDCLLNYETVKYFGGELHEGQRYAEAIREYQALEYKVISAWLPIHCCVIWSDTDRS